MAPVNQNSLRAQEQGWESGHPTHQLLDSRKILPSLNLDFLIWWTEKISSLVYTSVCEFDENVHTKDFLKDSTQV